MLFIAWIIHVIVAHNITTSIASTRVMYLLINGIGFLFQALVMGVIIDTRLNDTNIQMILAAAISILLFLIFFNISALSFSFIPESVDDFLSDYGYLGYLWSGIYLYSFIKNYRQD